MILFLLPPYSCWDMHWVLAYSQAGRTHSFLVDVQRKEWLCSLKQVPCKGTENCLWITADFFLPLMSYRRPLLDSGLYHNRKAIKLNDIINFPLTLEGLLKLVEVLGVGYATRSTDRCNDLWRSVKGTWYKKNYYESVSPMEMIICSHKRLEARLKYLCGRNCL